MSLLRRIEGNRPAGAPETPAVPGSTPPPAPPGGPLSQTATPQRDAMRDVRQQIQTKIINNLDPRIDLADVKAVRSSIEEMFNRFIDEEGAVITRAERQRMLDHIVDEILGFG
ncbi:MAG: CpaF family protein, partial [Candidatus Limnocylindria bacterium]|nr:CpaF family protein [Candidatus Limnocylindria bacterium]